MIKGTVIKVSIGITVWLLSLGFATTAQAATSTSDTGLAGITPALDGYYSAIPSDKTGEAEALLETLSEQTKETTNTTSMTEVDSPYANLGISIASDYVNIRTEPNTESEIVGKLYNGCATDIIETAGEWVKIHSGNVEGYIKAEYLAIGVEAEGLVEKYATKYATIINTQTLRVRAEQNTESTTITLVPEGETFYIVKEYEQWAEILIDGGDIEEESNTGFVSKDYIKIDVEFDYAISIAEEQEKLAAEEAARQAEIERLEELAQAQEAERKAEEERKAAAESAAKKAEEEKDKPKTSTSSSSSNSSSYSGSTSGQKVADYAVKFVGNPYVWGGESLTNGADCSGFVQSIYSHFGKKIDRTSREQASSSGYEVSINEIQAGDLIFYRNSGGVVNHVALYIGDGKIVHASNKREGIKISRYNYRTPYKVKRIL